MQPAKEFHRSGFVSSDVPVQMTYAKNSCKAIDTTSKDAVAKLLPSSLVNLWVTPLILCSVIRTFVGDSGVPRNSMTYAFPGFIKFGL